MKVRKLKKEQFMGSQNLNVPRLSAQDPALPADVQQLRCLFKHKAPGSTLSAYFNHRNRNGSTATIKRILRILSEQLVRVLLIRLGRSK